MKKEQPIHQSICKYIDLAYPNVIYLSDSSGVRLSIGAATAAKKLRCNNYVIPDLIILEPRGGYFGLILEIKASKEDLYLKDGKTLKRNEHILKQSEALSQLSRLEYKALFVCGFDEAKNVIDAYMGIENNIR